MTLDELESLAVAEARIFWASKTVKAVSGLIVASSGVYLQGVLVPPVPPAAPPLAFHAWLAMLGASVVALTVRHALAGIEAKQDAILAAPVTTTTLYTSSSASAPNYAPTILVDPKAAT